MSSLYWDTSAPYLVPSIVSMTKRDPSELIHIVFGFCDGIEFRLTMTDKEIESQFRNFDMALALIVHRMKI